MSKPHRFSPKAAALIAAFACGFAGPALAQQLDQADVAAEAAAADLEQANPDAPAPPPSVGDKAPLYGELALHTGDYASFDELCAENGLVVVFFRSAAWCPFCKAQLIDLNEHLGMITDRGYKLVALSYDDMPTLAQFAKQKQLGYPLVSDEGSRIIDAFGLRNENVKPGSRMDGIPHPAIYVIDPQGMIKDVLAEESYKDRPSVETIVEALDALAAQS